MINKVFTLYAFLFCSLGSCCSLALFSQSLSIPPTEQDREWMKHLCSAAFAGRGYVDSGVNKAAAYLEQELKKIGAECSRQNYSFPVNTYPKSLSCVIDNQILKEGRDYLMEAGGGSIHGNFRLLHYNMLDSNDLFFLEQKSQNPKPHDEAIVLHHTSPRAWKKKSLPWWNIEQWPLVIFTEDKKLTHSVSTETYKGVGVIVWDSLIHEKDSIQVHADHEFVSDYPCANIMGKISGKRNDSVVVFTAHYDHLGKMGNAVFPGASDNASGTAMLLKLAAYYAKHKPVYTTYFIFFSGEEAGLQGSRYFTEHSLIPLQRIRMVVNVDIMGNAENGITVVNAEEQSSFYKLLVERNKTKQLLTEIKSRAQTANSDHYSFSMKQVPAVFIYSLGGKGYYHDVEDTYENLGLDHYGNVFELLVSAFPPEGKKRRPETKRKRWLGIF